MMMMMRMWWWWCGGGLVVVVVVGVTTARGFRQSGGMSLGGRRMMSRVTFVVGVVVTGSLTGTGTHGISLYIIVYNIYMNVVPTQ